MAHITKTIGELLRDERESHRLPLSELAKKTRIRVEYLQALEENDFTSLPAATFVKGFIRSYARVFGFDPQPLIALLRRDFKESARGTLIPREFLKPVLTRKKMVNSVTGAVLTLGAVFLTLMSYVVFQWYSLQKPPYLEVSEPAEQARVAPQAVVQGETVPEAVVTVNGQPVALQPDGSFRTEVSFVGQGPAAVTVLATDRRGKSQTVQRTVIVEF